MPQLSVATNAALPTSGGGGGTPGTVSGVVILPNALLSIARPTYNSTTGATSAPTVYLANVLAHIEPNTGHAYMTLPASALAAEYTISVASGADIGAGAQITAITALDGVTPWPNETLFANDVWDILYAEENTAVFIPQRTLYVKRLTAQGPAHQTSGAPGVAVAQGPVFLPNVLLTTARPAYNGTTGATAAPVAYLSGIQAHIESHHASAYSTLPDAALNAPYKANVATGMDIAPGDWVTSITLLDGVTPWPNDTLSMGANVVWEVAFIRETPAVFLRQREVYLIRVLGGGPAHH